MGMCHLIAKFHMFSCPTHGGTVLIKLLVVHGAIVLKVVGLTA